MSQLRIKHRQHRFLFPGTKRSEQHAHHYPTRIYCLFHVFFKQQIIGWEHTKVFYCSFYCDWVFWGWFIRLYTYIFCAAMYYLFKLFVCLCVCQGRVGEFYFWNCWQPCETLKLQRSIHQWIKLSNWVKVLVHRNTHFKCNTLPKSLNYKIISHCTLKTQFIVLVLGPIQHI